MSNILKRWLGELEVHTKGHEFEKDFANGYKFGEVLEKCNLQRDFHCFTNSRAPQTMVENYSRLQPTFLELGIHFDSRIANQLIREEKGVAQKVVYLLWQAIAALNISREKIDKTGAESRQLGVSMKPSKGAIEIEYYNQSKRAYRSSKHRLFNSLLRAQADASNATMERAHLAPFHDYMADKVHSDSIAAERAAQEAALRQENSHNATVGALRSGIEWKKREELRQKSIHAELMAKQMGLERTDLMVEMSIAHRRQGRCDEKNRLARLEVVEGIHSFEDTLQKMPAATKASAINDANLLESTRKYMATLTAKRCQSDVQRKERQARRQRFILEQEQSVVEGDRRARRVAFLDTLNRKSGQEGVIAKRLSQLRTEADVLTSNRRHREEQYAQCRQRDWEECTRREKERWRLKRKLFEEAVAIEVEARNVVEEKLRKEEKEENTKICQEITWQIVKISELAAEYRSTMDALVPRKEYRQWMALFTSNDPSLHVARLSGRNLSDRAKLVIDQNAISDYLDCTGEWVQKSVIGHNAFLGDLLAEILSLASTSGSSMGTELNVRLKIAVLGPPFSGSTTISKRLGEEFDLLVVDPHKLAERVSQDGSDNAACETRGKLEQGASLDGEEMSCMVVKALQSVEARKVGDGDNAQEDQTPIQGIVVDGFPGTKSQAMLLEKALTGVDIDMEKQRISRSSRLAPPPPGYLPDPDRSLVSGLDAVITLRLDDEKVLLERALGQIMLQGDNSSNSGNESQDKESSQAAIDLENAAVQMQPRLAAYAREAKDLDHWLKRFELLVHSVDSSRSLEDVYEDCKMHVLDLIKAKDAADRTTANAVAAANAAESAKTSRDAAEAAMATARSIARELVLTKKAQLLAAQEVGSAVDEQDSIVNDEAVKICTEQYNKGHAAAIEASEAAERASKFAEEAKQVHQEILDASREASTCADTKQRFETNVEKLVESTKHAQEEAHLAVEAAKVAMEAVSTASQNAEEMHAENMDEIVSRFSQEAGEDNVEEDAAPPGPHRRPWSSDQGEVLYEKWKAIEATYFEGLSIVFANLREQRSNCLQHYITLRAHIDNYIKRPDDHSSQLHAFVAEYNSVNPDVRIDEAARAEWALRCNELVESIWESCDARKGESNEEIDKRLQTDFLSENSSLMGSLFVEGVQMELDRYLDTVAFCCNSARVAHGLPHVAKFPVGSADLLSDAVPRGLEGLLDPKTGIESPEWLTGGEQKIPNTFRACRAALATIEATKKKVLDVGSQEEAPAKGKKGKKGKSPEHEEELEELTPEQNEQLKVAYASIKECIERESEILEQRVQQLFNRAVVHVDELCECHQSARDHSENLVVKRYKAECSAASSLANVVMASISEGQDIKETLRFEGEYLIMEDVQESMNEPQVTPGCVDGPTEAASQESRGMLTDAQLEVLTTNLSDMCPSGYLRVCDLADVIAEQLSSDMDSAWAELDVKRFRKGLRCFESCQTGYANWREVVASFLIAQHGILADSTPETMANSAQILAGKCSESGSVSYTEWTGTKLWFDKDPNSAAIRKILWRMFSKEETEGSESTMDPTALLLYLCPAEDGVEGTRKAFAVVAKSSHRSAKIPSVEILRMIYPHGQSLNKDIKLPTWSAEEMDAMVLQTGCGNTDAEQPVLKFDQMMFLQATSTVANLLRARYQCRHPYVQARTVPEAELLT